jgi:FG-GAP-like repeat
MRLGFITISPGLVLLALLACTTSKPNRPQPNGLSFLPARDYVVGINPEAIAVRSFRRNSAVLDLAVANGGSNNVSVLLGNGDGTFQPPVSYDVGSYPWFVTAADLNADQVVDLVVSNRDSADLTVLLGVGDGTFRFTGTISLSEQPFSVGVADFNSDGRQDLVVTNLTNTFLLLGNGDGTFQLPSQVDGVGANTRFVAVADLNGDGIPDLAVTNWRGADSITTALGRGDGTFSTAGTFHTG